MMDAKKPSQEPVYVISVAARLADVHPQTLRTYERKGLINPARVHNRRRYSEADIERCRIIQELTREMGVNLAGVKMILDLRGRMDSLEEELEGMRKDLEERVRQVRESFRNDIVPVPRGEIMLSRVSNQFKAMRKHPGSSLYSEHSKEMHKRSHPVRDGFEEIGREKK